MDQATSHPLTIIILCWNRWDLTKRCLESVRHHTKDSDVEVLVVDNGSTDETPQRLAEIDWIRTLRNDTNLGFVRGNNAGLATVESDRDVLLLNNDVEILQSDWISELRRAAYVAPDIGVVGCRLVFPDGRLLHAGTRIEPDTLWGQQIGASEENVNQFASDRDVQGIVFACAYLKRKTLEAIGGLSEAYESYFEDTDYCLRAAEAGLRTVCCGSVTLLHAEHGSTSDHEGMFDKVFQRSRSEFRRRWLAKLEGHYRYDVHWKSVIGFPAGYATASRDILLGLDESGIRMSYSFAYGSGSHFSSPEPDNTGNHFLNVIKMRKSPSVPDLSVVFGHGDVLEAHPGRYRIGYTMADVDGFPPEWVRQANEMDEIWTPSRAGRKALVRCGVERPVYEMPLGVDVDRFHPGASAHPNPEGDFVFLASFRWSKRQDPGRLLRAFNAEFSSHEDVVLVCKVDNTDAAVDIRTEVESLGLKRRGGRITFLYNREFPRSEMPLLYRSADCYVAAGRGDDWGMALMEAMASGLPAIATDWGGNQDFIHPGVAYPLQTLGTTRAVAEVPHYEWFGWAEPDSVHLAKLMREVFENPEEASRRGRRASSEMATRWSTARMVQRIADRLDTVHNEIAAGGNRVKAPQKERHSTGASPRERTVAIDLSRALGEEVTGVGRYAQNVVRGLSQHPVADMDFLLLPGFGTYVHPVYGEPFFLDSPPGNNFAVYRGPLPAYAENQPGPRGVDLVHSTANMMPQSGDVRVLMTVHDLSFETHPQFHTEENIRLCKNSIDQAVGAGATFLSVSENTRRDLMRLHGVASDRIHVVYNSYDEDVFYPANHDEIDRVKRKYGLPEAYFLFLGTMEPRKNLITALDAINARDVGAPLVVAGARGWLEGPMRERLDAAGSRVQGIGFVAQEDLAGLYSGALSLVYPSLYEGFGLPLLESMACGTPVISSRVSAIPEVVGDSGILLEDPLDRDELAGALAQLGPDSPKRVRLGVAAGKQAQHFRLEKTTAALLDVYRAVLG